MTSAPRWNGRCNIRPHHSLTRHGDRMHRHLLDRWSLLIVATALAWATSALGGGRTAPACGGKEVPTGCDAPEQVCTYRGTSFGGQELTALRNCMLTRQE